MPNEWNGIPDLVRQEIQENLQYSDGDGVSRFVTIKAAEIQLHDMMLAFLREHAPRHGWRYDVIAERYEKDERWQTSGVLCRFI